MFKYYNANPLGRNVNDCTVRAISLATGKSWDETYSRLSDFAQRQAIMPDDVIYIDEYLEKWYEEIFDNKENQHITVEDFSKNHPKGTFLLTMRGHITCCIDGCIYDTFDPSTYYVWGAYEVK